MQTGNPNTQAKKFKALAREAECDESENNFDESLSRLARQKAPPVDKSVERLGKSQKKQREPAK